MKYNKVQKADSLADILETLPDDMQANLNSKEIIFIATSLRHVLQTF